MPSIPPPRPTDCQEVSLSPTYRVYRQGHCDLLPASGIADLRGSSGDFSLWIDLENRDVREAGKGVVAVCGRPVIGRLLCFLVINVGRAYGFEELYERVWCLPVNHLSEENVVKTTISRLRDLIEPVAPAWTYILTSQPFLGSRRKYTFNPHSRYCLIVPGDFQLFNS